MPLNSTSTAKNVVSIQAAASYTAQLTDRSNYTRFTNNSSVSFVIPASSPAATWQVGDELLFEQAGSGTVTPTGGTGVTISCRGTAVATAGQYAVAMLKCVALGPDVWILTGDVA